jgi:glycosyltransferase involved in cell wall biosynthesis
MTGTPTTVDRRIRVVVGGQLPPPLSGQHLALEAALLELRSDDRLKVDHLPYRFSKSIADQGRVSVRKAAGVGVVLGRLVRLRLSGRIDVFLHPIGGPSLSSTVKDLSLLPPIAVLSERTMLGFHGAGHAREWAGVRSPHVRLARRVLGRCDAAVVQSEANRIDPDWLGIKRLFVIPLPSGDQLDASLVQRNDVHSHIRVLYIGHLGPHRGIPQLVGAVAALSEEISGLELDLAGDPARGYEKAELCRHIERVGCGDRIRYHGTVVGRAKSELLGRAHILAFPSVFEAESFGLVLVEGLMWGLPLVATDWRANREVLAGASDVAIHPHQPDLQNEIMLALRTMATAVRRGEVPTFSSSNRAVFERRYLAKDGRSALADAVVELARSPRRRLHKERRAGAKKQRG